MAFVHRVKNTGIKPSNKTQKTKKMYFIVTFKKQSSGLWYFNWPFPDLALLLRLRQTICIRAVPTMWITVRKRKIQRLNLSICCPSVLGHSSKMKRNWAGGTGTALWWGTFWYIPFLYWFTPSAQKRLWVWGQKRCNTKLRGYVSNVILLFDFSRMCITHVALA